MKPEPERTEQEPRKNSLFRWTEATQEIHFANDKIIRLTEDDERLESNDGQLLLIYGFH